jgi:hypothetical protein
MAKKDIEENKAPQTEDEVEIEYDLPGLPDFIVKANRISSEEHTDKLWAKYEAEKPVRDSVQAKREKILQELLGLGLSEETARFLAHLEE